MSYATSLLMAYPPPYGPSTLLSDDLVQRSLFPPYYESSPSITYRSNSHLLSDSFAYNPINLGPTSYRSTSYPHFSSITDWQRDIPARTSYTSINNVREYSDSLGTASNTNTESSIRRSADENIFPNYQQSYNRFSNDVVDRNSHLTTIWSPPHNERLTITHRSLPEQLSATKQHQKKSPIEEIKKQDTAPIIPSPPPPPPPPPPVVTKQENEIEKQEPTVDVQAWLSESKKGSPTTDEQVWTNKIDQLHTTQAQREKEKTKVSHVLPNLIKKNDHKSSGHENKSQVPSYQHRNETYFDSIFDGNYYRKTSTNHQNSGSSYQQTSPLRNRSKTNSFNQPKTTIFSNYVTPRKVPQYEPPNINRAPPPPAATSWKKQGQNQNQNDSTTPRETIHKDSEERFREALQKFRADRAEQQQKELPESTAKRLNYGDYVRRSTRDGSLHNVIKSLPWSGFFDLKKGNVYSLTKQEKKDLYYQSKSYGERVRYRHFGLHHGNETVGTEPLFPIEDKESQSGDEPINDDSKSLKRSNSSSTNKTFSKQIINNDIVSNRSEQTNKFTNQSSSSNESSEHETSDFESTRKDKPKIYKSSIRTITTTTTRTDESDNDETSDLQSSQMKTQDTDDDNNLFTVHEEKTLISSGNSSSKKMIDNQI